MEILSIHVYMGPESDHYLPLSPSAVFNIVIKLPQIPPKNCINLYFHTLPQIIISINCQCHLFFFVFYPPQLSNGQAPSPDPKRRQNE